MTCKRIIAEASEAGKPPKPTKMSETKASVGTTAAEASIASIAAKVAETPMPQNVTEATNETQRHRIFRRRLSRISKEIAVPRTIVQRGLFAIKTPCYEDALR